MSESTSLILRGGTLVDLSKVAIKKADLLISDGKIVSDSEGFDGAHEIDCSGCLILPGIVCGHGHLYSALATGMPGPAEAPTNFSEILDRIWWRLDEALDEDSLRASAQVGALGAIRSGSTSIIDHHASPSFIDGCLDVIADALDDVGLRSVLCYEVTDRGGVDKRDAGLRENERFIQANREFSKGLVGGHASFTLSDDSLQACADLVKRLNSGFHCHLAEDLADQRNCLDNYGMLAAERFQKAGVFGPRTLLVHGVFLGDSERKLISESDCWVAHNPRSNMNNSVGYAAPSTLGSRVILGTDGIGADMFAESQHAFFRARETSLSTDAAVVLGWLTKGAELMSDLFATPIGTLAPDSVADVIVVEAPLATPLSEGNFPWHWMFGFSSRMVRDVITRGQVVMQDRKILSVDEEAILANARELAPALWSRM